MPENSQYFVILSQFENDETPLFGKSAQLRGFGGQHHRNIHRALEYIDNTL